MNDLWLNLFYLFSYVMLPFIFFYKFKLARDSQVNNNFLTMENTNVLKGLMTILIVAHHFSQRIEGTLLKYPLFFSGYLWVGIFLFLSGYGLTMSFQKNKNYLSDFLIKRLSRLIIPLFFVNFIMGIISNIILKTEITLSDLLVKTLMLQAVNSEVDLSYWYIKVMFLLYIIFYFTFKLVSSKYLVIVNFSVVSLYICLMIILGFENFWINSSLSFPFGILVGLNKDVAIKLIKDNRVILTIISLIIFGGSYLFSSLIATNGLFKLILQIVAVNSLIIFITVFLSSIKLHSRILSFLSKASLEVYVIHLSLLFIIMEYYEKLDNIMFFLILLISFTIGLLIHFISNSIINSLFKKRNQLSQITE